MNRMTFVKYIIRILLHIQLNYNKLFRKGPFDSSGPKYLMQPESGAGGGLKQNLFKHHVKQFSESSCSVASVVSVVNAILDTEGRMKTEPETQQGILDKVRAGFWKERMSTGGHNGKRGLPLDVLGEVVLESMRVYGIEYEFAEVVEAREERNGQKARQTVLKERLVEFENDGRSILIAHFNQGILVPALQIPHISPVGGYNAETDMVTVLDVDYLQKKNYEVPFKRFYESISSDYNNLFRFYGYGAGGYVYIRLKENQNR